MKKIIIAAGLLMYTTVVFANNPPEVTEKVLDAFKNTFCTAQDVKWFDSESGGYKVYFKCDDIQSRVWYDKKGNIIVMNRHYGENNLPPYILAKIKMTYSGKTVFSVTEISNENGVAYFVNLEDAKTWLIVKSDEKGELEVYDKFKKA